MCNTRGFHIFQIDRHYATVFSGNLYRTQNKNLTKYSHLFIILIMNTTRHTLSAEYRNTENVLIMPKDA